MSCEETEKRDRRLVIVYINTYVNKKTYITSKKNKPYVNSLFLKLHFISVTLKGQPQPHSGFETLYLINEPKWVICY